MHLLGLIPSLAAVFSNLGDMHRRVRPAEGDSELSDLTMQEVSAGYAQGPITEAEMTISLEEGVGAPLCALYIVNLMESCDPLTVARRQGTMLLLVHARQYTQLLLMLYLQWLLLLALWFAILLHPWASYRRNGRAWQ
jgi:hypothetical protein